MAVVLGILTRWLANTSTLLFVWVSFTHCTSLTPPVWEIPVHRRVIKHLSMSTLYNDSTPWLHGKILSLNNNKWASEFMPPLLQHSHIHTWPWPLTSHLENLFSNVSGSAFYVLPRTRTRLERMWLLLQSNRLEHYSIQPSWHYWHQYTQKTTHERTFDCAYNWLMLAFLDVS